MILAFVSDNHGPLPPRLFDRLAGVDRIFHLGDLGSLSTLAELEALAPTLAVRGNVDPVGLPALPEERRVEIDGLTLLLRHEPWSEGTLAAAGETVFAHGHTHVPDLKRFDRACLLCPGALSRPRRGHPPSCALLACDARLIQASIVALEDGRILEQIAWARA